MTSRPDHAAADLAAAYRAAREGCVMVDRSDAGKLAVIGPEAIAYLQAHLSADVVSLPPGRGTLAAVLAPKGTLLGLVRALRMPRAMLLDCDREALDGVFLALYRGRIGWDAELQGRTIQLSDVALIGPAACDVAGVDPALPPHAHRVVRVGRTAALAIRTPGGVDLRCATDRFPALVSALADAGAHIAGRELWELVRVEAGRPRFGAELDERTLPADAGLVPDVVSPDKGLYPGLQTVLRQERSGTVHRALRGLRLDAPVPNGADVFDEDGTALGAIGTAVVSPDQGALALGVLRRSATAGSTVVVGPDGIPATVVELPWEPDAERP